MTTDRHLLKEHGVDHVHRVKELDESESLELFNSVAFNQATSCKRFTELSKQIVVYSGGLPLALKKLGMFLCRRNVLEWKGVLRSLEKLSFPSQVLLEALKKSFRDLSDEEKKIFFDIAFSLSG
jgi:hypothetical protein